MSPRFKSSLYRTAIAAVLSFPLIAGCQSAMSQTESGRYKAPNEFPLTFVGHNFDVYCYNTIGCRVIYDNHNFSPYVSPRDGDPDAYVAPPPKPDYKRHLDASYLVMRNLQTDGFPGPVQVRWKSLDGAAHEATLNLDEIFPDRRVLHHVPESDYAERSFGGRVDIILEVNDRTLTIYQKALVATKTEQIPGNKHSYGRVDVIQAWSRTY
jgi:hypothetical protein